MLVPPPGSVEFPMPATDPRLFLCCWLTLLAAAFFQRSMAESFFFGVGNNSVVLASVSVVVSALVVFAVVAFALVGEVGLTPKETPPSALPVCCTCAEEVVFVLVSPPCTTTSFW